MECSSCPCRKSSQKKFLHTKTPRFFCADRWPPDMRRASHDRQRGKKMARRRRKAQRHTIAAKSAADPSPSSRQTHHPPSPPDSRSLLPSGPRLPHSAKPCILRFYDSTPVRSKKHTYVFSETCLCFFKDTPVFFEKHRCVFFRDSQRTPVACGALLQREGCAAAPVRLPYCASMSMALLMNLLSCSPLSRPFCSKARATS